MQVRGRISMHRKQGIIFSQRKREPAHSCCGSARMARVQILNSLCVYMFWEKLWAVIGPLHVNRCTIRRGSESREGQQSRAPGSLTRLRVQQKCSRLPWASLGFPRSSSSSHILIVVAICGWSGAFCLWSPEPVAKIRAKIPSCELVEKEEKHLVAAQPLQLTLRSCVPGRKWASISNDFPQMSLHRRRGDAHPEASSFGVSINTSRNIFINRNKSCRVVTAHISPSWFFPHSTASLLCAYICVSSFILTSPLFSNEQTR